MIDILFYSLSGVMLFSLFLISNPYILVKLIRFIKE